MSKERSPKDLVGDAGQSDTLGLARPPIFSDQPWAHIDESVANRRAPRETIVALARKHTVEAILTLIYHMRNSRDPEISMRAAEILIERGWGKSPQVVGVVSGGEVDVSGQPKLGLEEKIAILEAAAAGEMLPLSVSPEAIDVAPAGADLLE